jgi:hypothetical protein
LLVVVRWGLDSVVSACVRRKEAMRYGRGGEATQLGGREMEGEDPTTGCCFRDNWMAGKARWRGSMRFERMDLSGS